MRCHLLLEKAVVRPFPCNIVIGKHPTAKRLAKCGPSPASSCATGKVRRAGTESQMTARRSAAALTRPRLPASGRLDRGLFLRPIAHRGLHDRARAAIENTAAAFLAAIDKGYGIECDLQPASDGTPMVFHDERLERLVAASGPIAAHTPAQLARLRYRRHDTSILRFAEFLELVGRPRAAAGRDQGQRPRAAASAFLDRIARQAQVLQRPDRAHVLQPRDRRRARAARSRPSRAVWWSAATSCRPRGGQRPVAANKARILTRMLGSAPDGLAFFAVDVRMLRSRARLDAPGTRRSWRSSAGPSARRASARSAARWADAPIFEGYEA